MSDNCDDGSGGKPAEQHPIALAIQSFEGTYKSTKANPTHYEREAHRWALRTGNGVIAYTLMTAIIMAASVATAIFSKWQADTNQASFVSAQRAYMYYAGMNTGKYRNAAGQYVFTIAPLFGNSGNTPTENLLSRANCWPDEKEETDPFDHFRSLNDKAIPGFYGPRATLQTTVCNFTADQVRSIANHVLHWYLAGEAIYQDAVDPKKPQHITQFATEFIVDQFDEAGAGITGATAQRGRHNCADDGCPKD